MCDSCVDSGIKYTEPDPKWKQDRLRLAELMLDLDRCEHGRHAKDPCSSCQREYSVDNTGNTCLEPGERIGTTLYGKPIVVPERKDRYDPDAWIQS